MKAVFNVARYTLKENARSRSFSLSVLFIILVFVSAFVFSRLSQIVETRAIRDIGLGAIQFFSLITVLFFAIKVALLECLNKTIYLPLTRPVKRTEYLFGRFTGIVFAAALEIAAMGVLLTLLLVLKKAELSGFYFLCYLFIFLKITMITAVAVLVSLACTSQASAFVFSFLIWIAGHILGEIEFLAEKLPAAVTVVLKVFRWILPNYTVLNLQDYVAGRFLTSVGVAPAALYAIFYTLAVMCLAAVIFEKKEF